VDVAAHAETGITPLAYVFNSVNPILAQGAAFGEMTMVDRFEAGDVTKLFRTGDELLIDPELGNVTIVKRAPEHS
jgi:predicted aconitase with swiveling domain